MLLMLHRPAVSSLRVKSNYLYPTSTTTYIDIVYLVVIPNCCMFRLFTSAITR
jgi:hypothetical protein